MKQQVALVAGLGGVVALVLAYFVVGVLTPNSGSLDFSNPVKPKPSAAQGTGSSPPRTRPTKPGKIKNRLASPNEHPPPIIAALRNGSQVWELMDFSGARGETTEYLYIVRNHSGLESVFSKYHAQKGSVDAMAANNGQEYTYWEKHPYGTHLF